MQRKGREEEGVSFLLCRLSRPKYKSNWSRESALGCAGLGWAGLGWAGLGWLDWTGLDRTGLD